MFSGVIYLIAIESFYYFQNYNIKVN